ncbi:MAG TPA: hypothetical protein VJU61_13830 [Polyangiaceae bacterium]|nr:hypothetical protein [Polyangiaceae bacterium]
MAGQAQDFNVRGYMYVSAVNYLRQVVGEEEAKRVIGGFSPEARHLLEALKSAEWCPVSVFSEATQAIAKAGGGGERSQDLLIKCGTHVAVEASNTFLKLFMKMMSTQLLVKKVPDLWRRDCSGGKLVLEELGGKSVRFSTSGMQGYQHAVCTAAGFVAFGLGAIGKKVDSITIRGWSVDKPSDDGATFELSWSN